MLIINFVTLFSIVIVNLITSFCKTFLKLIICINNINNFKIILIIFTIGNKFTLKKNVNDLRHLKHFEI